MMEMEIQWKNILGKYVMDPIVVTCDIPIKHGSLIAKPVLVS